MEPAHGGHGFSRGFLLTQQQGLTRRRKKRTAEAAHSGDGLRQSKLRVPPFAPKWNQRTEATASAVAILLTQQQGLGRRRKKRTTEVAHSGDGFHQSELRVVPSRSIGTHGGHGFSRGFLLTTAAGVRRRRKRRTAEVAHSEDGLRQSELRVPPFAPKWNQRPGGHGFSRGFL